MLRVIDFRIDQSQIIISPFITPLFTVSPLHLVQDQFAVAQNPRIIPVSIKLSTSQNHVRTRSICNKRESQISSQDSSEK